MGIAHTYLLLHTAGAVQLAREAHLEVIYQTLETMEAQRIGYRELAHDYLEVNNQLVCVCPRHEACVYLNPSSLIYLRGNTITGLGGRCSYSCRAHSMGYRFLF